MHLSFKRITRPPFPKKEEFPYPPPLDPPRAEIGFRSLHLFAREIVETVIFRLDPKQDETKQASRRNIISRCAEYLDDRSRCISVPRRTIDPDIEWK